MLGYARRTTAGSGDLVPNTAQSDGSLNVYQAALLAGELQQFNRMAGGAIFNYTYVTADTVIKGTPGIIYGVYCVAGAAVASPILYDNASAASGNIMMPSSSMTAGTTPPLTYGGGGLQTVNGIYADWTAGTFLVLWV